MPEAQSQMEENEIDEVAQKAEEIGKAIGVEKNEPPKDDDTPDYEIVEEDDERIAKEREPRAAADNRRKLTTKEKRDARKRAVDRKLSERDSIIEFQNQKLQELETWKNQVEGRLTGVDKAKVDDAMANLGAAYNKAKADYTAAFTEGDGEKAAAAMTAMYEHQRKYEDLQKVKQQLERAPAAPQNNNAPNPKIISKAKAWAAKHDWYDPSGKDEDSEIAKSISQVLANEGLDPSTDKFWSELDKRLIKRGVIDADEVDEDEEDDYEDEEPVAKKPKKRSSPPVSGGSNRGDTGGKVKISLPTRYVNMLKTEGIWDDIPRRNRVIQGYLKARREAQANQ